MATPKYLWRICTLKNKKNYVGEIARIKGERADVFYFYKRRYNVTGIPDPVIY